MRKTGYICRALMLFFTTTGCGSFPRNNKRTMKPSVKKTLVAGISMVSIPGGTFRMGSRLSAEEVKKKFGGDVDPYKVEHPVHTVTLDGFEMSAHAITVDVYRKFVDTTGYKTDVERGEGANIFNGSKWEQKSDAHWRNPYYSQSDDYPVTCVSWNDAKAFCEWLSSETGNNFSMPTEAEWEYACRAGTETIFYTGNNESVLARAGWYIENSGKKTHPVGQKEPNAWGLYDMHGNIWEWCNDWYDENYYSSSPSTNPSGPAAGSRRVIRGGCWFSNAGFCRSASRSGDPPVPTYSDLGFRVVRRP